MIRSSKLLLFCFAAAGINVGGALFVIQGYSKRLIRP